jgi:hypothetical protein
VYENNETCHKKVNRQDGRETEGETDRRGKKLVVEEWGGMIPKSKPEVGEKC